MGEKRYFWLKLYDDFFSSKRIKKLRTLAGGDTYTIIYLKMQLKALKDEGYLYFDGIMDDFAEELALDIDEKPEDVKLTIQYLLSVGLLQTDESREEWYLTYTQKCIGSETASAQRVRDFRERKKQDNTLQCNADVTEVKPIGSVEIEKEKDIDIEIDIEKDINSLSKDKESSDESDADVIVSANKSYSKDIASVVEAWNKTDFISVDKIRSSSQRYKRCVARIKEFGLEKVLKAIQVANESDFLKQASWFNFDWFVRPNNFPKVLDGNYNVKKKSEYKPDDKYADYE